MNDEEINTMEENKSQNGRLVRQNYRIIEEKNKII